MNIFKNLTLSVSHVYVTIDKVNISQIYIFLFNLWPKREQWGWINTWSLYIVVSLLSQMEI